MEINHNFKEKQPGSTIIRFVFLMIIVSLFCITLPGYLTPTAQAQDNLPEFIWKEHRLETGFNQAQRGVTWTYNPEGFTTVGSRYRYDSLWHGDIYTAYMFTSEDGDNWDSYDYILEQWQYLDDHHLNSIDSASSVRSIPALFVKVGGSGQVYISPDGTEGSWIEEDTPTDNNLKDVVIGSGRQDTRIPVAVGENATIIRGKTDGSGWDLMDIPQGVGGLTFNAICEHSRMAGGHFWVVGQKGIVLSHEGFSEGWQSLGQAIENDLNGVAFYQHRLADGKLENRLIAVGEKGTIVTSSAVVGSGDTLGEKWERQDSGTNSDLNDIHRIWTGTRDLFVVVGNDGTILTSYYGLKWKSSQSNTTQNLFAVTSSVSGKVTGDEKVVAVGDNNLILVADYPKNWEYEITATAVPKEGGQVKGGGFYEEGHEATVTAKPNPGYEFVNWTTMIYDIGFSDEIILSTDAEYTFKVDKELHLRANFTDDLIVKVEATPSNAGTVTGGGLYAYGEEVTVKAKANEGYEFVHWIEFIGESPDFDEKVLVSTDPEYTFTATSDHYLVAEFQEETDALSIKAEVTPTHGGTVAGDGLYDHGEEVTLKAEANEGYEFVHWFEYLGDPLEKVIVSYDPEYTFTATSDRYLVAEFRQETDAAVNRLSGTNRYLTAVEVSKDGWASADTVLLASGQNYPDALAGAPLAYQLDAPILLTDPNQLSGDTLSEIVRLNPNRIIILGGESAVSAGIQSTLQGMVTTVERLGGVNRYDTSKKIAEKLLTEGGSFDEAFITYGRGFPDALAAAAYAAKRGSPILLTESDSIPSHTSEALTNLGINSTYVVGGSTVISNNVLNQLPGSQRISGANRYLTAQALAEEFLAAGTEHIYIATGLNYPDALAGGVLAAKNNSGVLLVPGSHASLPLHTVNFINNRGFISATIYGGNSAVSTGIENQLKSMLE